MDDNKNDIILEVPVKPAENNYPWIEVILFAMGKMLAGSNLEDKDIMKQIAKEKYPDIANELYDIIDKVYCYAGKGDN